MTQSAPASLMRRDRPQVEQVGQTARRGRVVAGLLVGQQQARSPSRAACSPAGPTPGSSRIALACLVSTSVTMDLELLEILVADGAAALLGERLLQRAALIHGGGRDHAAIVRHRLHACEFAWCDFHGFNSIWENGRCSTTARSTAPVDNFVDRQVRLGAFHLVALRLRRRMPRREQRAAVLIRDDRDGIGAEPLRLGGDLVLVHADERPQHRQRHDAADRRHVLERLRRHLADDVAGDERLRRAAAARSARRCASSAAGRRRRAAAARTARTTCC